MKVKFLMHSMRALVRGWATIANMEIGLHARIKRQITRF
jgi:hypothetical protein